MQNQKRISLKDVAKEAGVSAMSVSAALNGCGRISEEKAVEIRRLAAKMGYRTNAAAQILKSRRGKNIGLLFLETLNLVRRVGALSEMALVFSEECRRLGLRAHVEWFDYRANPQQYPDVFFNGLVDGLLVYGYGSREINECLTKGLSLPFVRLMEPGEYSVHIDYRHEITEIMTWLAARGHRRFVFVNENAENGFHIFKTAKTAFFEQIRELALPPQDQFYFQNTAETAGYAAKIEELTTKIINAKPTALVIYCTETAKAVICELIRRGLRVPEDISVIAFGSYDFDAEFNIPITSVDTDVKEIVINAVRLLRERMENKKILTPSIALQPGLTQRGSAININRSETQTELNP